MCFLLRREGVSLHFAVKSPTLGLLPKLDVGLLEKETDDVRQLLFSRTRLLLKKRNLPIFMAFYLPLLLPTERADN